MAALKGAFHQSRSRTCSGALPNIVVFQFNPDTSDAHADAGRSRLPPTIGAGSIDAAQQPGQPSESISFTLRIDATDQLAQGNPIAAASGILPTLSALELLMVPESSLQIDLFSLAGGASAGSSSPPTSCRRCCSSGGRSASCRSPSPA